MDELTDFINRDPIVIKQRSARAHTTMCQRLALRVCAEFITAHTKYVTQLSETSAHITMKTKLEICIKTGALVIIRQRLAQPISCHALAFQYVTSCCC